MAIFTNQARLTYNGLSVNSNVAQGELLEILSATKTMLAGSYRIGATESYVISILNSGTSDMTGVTVVDDLGGYPFGSTTVYPLSYLAGSVKYYVNGVLQPSPTITEGPPVQFTGINIPQGGNAMIIYEASVTEYAPLGDGAIITNTATVTAAGIATPVTATAVSEVDNAPLLSITKSLSPTPVAENGRLTYTFVILNEGAAETDSTDNVSVSDVFNPALTDLTVTLNGTPFTEYTYDATTATFTTTPGSISIPAATYVQDTTTGLWQIDPGSAVLIITGTV